MAQGTTCYDAVPGICLFMAWEELSDFVISERTGCGKWVETIVQAAGMGHSRGKIGILVVAAWEHEVHRQG